MNHAVLICTPNVTKGLLSYIDQLLQNHIPQIVVCYNQQSMDIPQSLMNTSHCTWIPSKKNQSSADAMLSNGLVYCLQNFSNYAGIITTYHTTYTIEDILKISVALSNYPNDLVIGISETSKKKDWLWKATLKAIYGKSVQDFRTHLYGLPFSKVEWLRTMAQNQKTFRLSLLISTMQQHISIQEVIIHFTPLIKDNTRYLEKIYFFLTLFKGILYYALSTLGAGIIDITAFYLLFQFAFQNLGFGTNLFLATVMARALSSVFNYWVNKKFVFQHRQGMSTSIVKYYTLWLTLMLLSYALMYISAPLLTTVIPIAILKLFVDGFLGLLSYQVQLHWVFKKNYHKRRHQFETND